MALRRLALALVAATALGSAFIHAQIPGRNVNMVSGTSFVEGDPFLQRQNEPSIATSTRNPLHLLAGSNDYRTVDLPGVPGSEETGDAWLSYYTSTDGGQRWVSTLVPGYPQDPKRNLSPLKNYAAAADPVLRAGTNGLVYYVGLAFNRGENAASAVFVTKFIDDNNRTARNPFTVLGTKVVSSDTGVTGRFLDKPWLAVDIPRDNRTCPVTTTVLKPPASPGGQPISVNETHNLPAGPVYVAYSAFTGAGSTLKSDIMFSYSTNCGETWSTPLRLSANDGSINQGATIAIEPNTGAVTVAWRRFTRAGSTQTDAIMVAQSLTLGRVFLNQLAIRKLPRLRSLVRVIDTILEHRRQKGGVEVEELSEFDQITSAADLQFRTNTYPTMTWDDKGRLYVAWSERGFSTAPGRGDPQFGDAKIVIATALLGLAWSAPKAVSEVSSVGTQIMPSLSVANGKLMLVYYDLREDVSQVFGQFIDDKSAATSSGKRHTLDIRASMGTPGLLFPTFAPSVRVSDYFIGHRTVPNPQHFIACPGNAGHDCEQLQFNPPNLPMFKQGTVPFFGDYIDLSAAPSFVPVGRGGWAYNTSKSAVPVFNAVWTDNRDVRPPANGDWTKYTPPDLNGAPTHVSPIDGSTVVCDPSGDNIGSRNQNVYTARITGGLLVGSPENTKPLASNLQRGFVVFAQNMTSVVKTFRMRVTSQPVGGFASFQQIFTQPVTFIDVVTPARSTAARTLYVTSSDEHARVTVEVFEISQAGNGTPAPGGLSGTVILNADIENADIENADIENADIENADIENTEVTSADIENPSFRSADIENADIENADIENADIENADIENADIENADIENADIENTPFQDAPQTDITWSVTNTGNTTSAFNVNLFLSQAAPAGSVNTQLILHKAYLTPAAASCDLKVRSNTVLVANITNPSFVTPTTSIPDPNSPSANNAVLLLGPKEKGYITLRIRDIDPTDNVIIINDKGEPISVDSHFVPGTTLAPIVAAMEIGTKDLAAGVTKPPITTTDGSTMFFVTQPTTAAAGVVMNPVRVQVRDKSGAVLPGVDVTLSLSSNPTETTLGGVLTKTTDATGIAVFDTLQINTPGDGYKLRATASRDGSSLGISPADSVPFSVRIMVLNTNDAGPGSLRDAIVLANANAGVRDVISFSISGEGPQTITPQSPLPGINDPAVLDATPGGACTGGAPTVEIDGVSAGLSHGLVVNASGSVIRGLSITRFAPGFAGIFIGGGSGSAVECSYIGLAPFGTVKPNGDGIRISGSSNNIIGGTTVFTRNVISGNATNGVTINGPTPNSEFGFALQTLVQGNYIGLDASGTLDRGNGGNGVTIANAQLNTIAGNVISGNGGEGIGISGVRSTGNMIQGNYIGTNASGAAAVANNNSGIYARRAGQNSIIGNVVSGNAGFAGIAVCGTPAFCGGGEDAGLSSDASGNIIRGNIVGLTAAGTDPLRNAGYGVSLDGAPNTTVGGSVAGEPNVISSNGPAGLIIFGDGANGNIVRGNYIGTDITGTLDRHNNGPGVSIAAGSDNTISGNDADRTGPNVIMFNTGAGISVSAGTRNKLRINRIDQNAGIGIDLGPAGVTANDPGDGDAGANDLQNAPILTTAQIANGTVNIQGSLNGIAFQRFTVDLYVSPACDPSGFGEGRQWFGGFIADTNSDGNVSFSTSFGGGVVTAGQVVTAVVTSGDFITVATPGTGSTSEFSNCVTATSSGVVGSTTDPTGDATPFGGVPGPDLVSTTVLNTGTALVFQVRFAPGTFNPQTATAQLLLDTDRIAATGHPGTDSGCQVDAGVIGSEYFVNASDGTGEIFQYQGTCNNFESVSSTSVSNVANGYDITVPLAIINSNGVLNYKVVTFEAGTAVLDVMPNNGLPAATTGGGATPALLIDTGPASSPGLSLIPASAGNFQFIAARFTLAVPTVITSVEGWMGPVFAGGMNIQIRSDANGLPGASVFSKSYAMVQASDTAWRSFPNLGATLNAGSYWLAFEPSTAFSSMPSGAQSPLGKYAIYFAPNGAYLDMQNVALGGALPSVGVRVWGMPSPPPCGSSCAP